MRKPTMVTAAFVLMVVLSLAFTKDDPLYKNLKVLPKRTTKQQMDSVMRHFTGALGVKCNFCHVFNQEQKAMDFASDANEHKGIARQMMQMTNKLNKRYFDVKNSKDLSAKLEVTCYSCHNGKEDPVRFVPAQQRSAGGPAAAGAAGAQTDTTRKQQ